MFVYVCIVQLVVKEEGFDKKSKEELKKVTSDGTYFAYNAKILYGTIAVALITLLAILCGMKTIQRKVPVNYILGFTNAFSMCYISGFLTFKI